MFERKDISNLKKDIVLDVNLFDCSLNCILDGEYLVPGQ